MTLVFVYGTLKRGGSNHSLLAGQHYRGEARTVPGFTLFEIDDYPGMVPCAEDLEGVTGEIWEVDGECLHQLDELEGVSEGLYERVRIPLAPPAIPRIIDSYLFLRPLAGRRRLGSTWH